MERPQDFAAVQQGMQDALVAGVKAVNRLAAEDLSFQRTVNPDVAEQLDGKAARLLSLSTRLLRSAAGACGLQVPLLQDVDDIDYRWQSIVDVVDSVLEKADTALDEYTGLVKRKDPPVAEEPPPKKVKPMSKAIRNANVSKPQGRFDRLPDNYPTKSWKPILSKKPHATLPLDESLTIIPGEDGSPQHKHPYEAEISAMQYPSRVYHSAEPIPPQPFEKGSAIWIDTYEGVLEMLQELKQCEDIAVDLEHHDWRTYNGVVCLMQISSRTKDWIIDTLQPWRDKLEVLNQVFADPRIIKVFHGAYMDIVWLQRDLGLYVNALFDTYFACDILSYPGKSLAFLLSKFVKFDADKQYQLADWRIRPLPAEMLYYAQSDTHYLLYIFDNLRNELVSLSDQADPEASSIARALERSKELALHRHEHPGCDPATGQGSRGWLNFILRQAHLGFDGEQFATFRALWTWRDDTARREDENPNFVLSSQSVVNIARAGSPDVKALHSLLPPSASLARARLNEIWKEVAQARAVGGPSILQFLSSSTAPAGDASSGTKPRTSLTIGSAITKAPPVLNGDLVIRSMTHSHLFGDVTVSSRWELTHQAALRQEDACIPFPWQQFAETVAQEVDSAREVEDRTPEQDDAGAPEETTAVATVTEETEDKEFTLKKGQRHQSPEPEVNDDSSASEKADRTLVEDEREALDMSELLAFDSDDGSGAEHAKQHRGTKGSRDKGVVESKADRKARKARKKERREKKRQEQREQEGGVPFDYSKASSVLHAKKADEGDAATDPREKKKIFDPYAHIADDGLKGAKRAPPVRGERSATFKK